MNMEIASSRLKSIDMLPEIKEVYETCQSLAVIEAILMQEWDFRYFSFNSSWDVNKSMASMRDGCGSHYYMTFDSQLTKCLGKLYNKPIGVKDTTPIKDVYMFEEFLQEPAFENEDATIYYYKTSNKIKWQSIPFLSDIPFLGFLVNKENAYIPWAESCYEIEIKTQPVIDIFNYQPVTSSMVNQLNPNCCISTLIDDLNEINYPFRDL